MKLLYYTSHFSSDTWAGFSTKSAERLFFNSIFSSVLDETSFWLQRSEILSGGATCEYIRHKTFKMAFRLLDKGFVD